MTAVDGILVFLITIGFFVILANILASDDEKKLINLIFVIVTIVSSMIAIGVSEPTAKEYVRGEAQMVVEETIVVGDGVTKRDTTFVYINRK